ncbi:MAG: hypothetical protein FH756_17575 [Firmicutes bacterium]|nr:hypothetical protein [Bacillota bacterium]
MRAQQARDNAANAHTDAQAARNLLNGASNGGKSLTATYDAANAASGDADYIRHTQLPSIENKIANLETTVNNINNDTMAPIVKVQTLSGARATSASSIQGLVTVTDNSAGPYEYRVNGGSWGALPGSGEVALPVTQPGMNAITVEVRDPSGNVGKDAITIRKL